MSTSNEQAKKEYAEFEEKVKRTLFIDNLSPQVTRPILQTAIEQFGTVLNVEFISNDTIPYPVPQCALVEMKDQKQARGVIETLTNFPFMVSGMPRPVRAIPATIEMFADRPPPPDRKFKVRWLEPSDPEFEAAKKMKQLSRKQHAETLALIKLIQEEEEKIAEQQEGMIKSIYKKYEMIESVMQDGSVSCLARYYGLNLTTDN